MPRSRPLKIRFEEKFIPEPNSGCWLWIAGVGTHGYGIIGTSSKKTETAHRVSMRLYKGIDAGDFFVLHKCDVRTCVNPNHLYIGTVKDNARDLMERGKPYCKIREYLQSPELERKRVESLPRGRDHHRSYAKITEKQALEIYNAKGTQWIIAARFGISQQEVSLIKRKLRWDIIHADT